MQLDYRTQELFAPRSLEEAEEDLRQAIKSWHTAESELKKEQASQKLDESRAVLIFQFNYSLEELAGLAEGVHGQG